MPQSQVDPFTAVAEGQRQDVYAALARSGLTALPVALHPVVERNPT